MKKRLILTNMFLVLGALLLLLSFSIIAIININNNNTKQDLKTYLKISTNTFNGTNYQETVNVLQQYNNDLRITFIDLSGKVLYDSNTFEELESHLNRPEISNLGTVFIRYSETLNTKMFYIAEMDNSHYLRLALPTMSIKGIINSYIFVGIISLIIILTLTIILGNSIMKRNLEPLNKVVNRLGSIVNSDNLYGVDSVKIISKHIDNIKTEINNKINTLNFERLKIEYIINSLNSGLIVLDRDKNIILINNYACNLFDCHKDNILNKNYLYLIRNTKLQKKIDCTYSQNKIDSLELTIKDKIYNISFNLLDFTWIQNGGLIVSIIDITEAKRIEKIKKEFFANASHELKSPLTTIIGYQQMIQEGIINDKEGLKAAAKVTIKEAMRMNKIIVEMLELSKLESETNPKLENIDISQVVDEVLLSFKKEIKEKNISVIKNLEKLIVKMNNLNAIALVRNLIDNAIKYNVFNGKLIIIVNNNQLIVEDTGIGIAKENQSRVFERFYRVDKGKSKESGGTGLGLAIVKHICNLYNFSLDLQSELNKGTKIIVTFSK